MARGRHGDARTTACTCSSGCSELLLNVTSRLPAAGGRSNAKSRTGFGWRHPEVGRSRVSHRVSSSPSSETAAANESQERGESRGWTRPTWTVSPALGCNICSWFLLLVSLRNSSLESVWPQIPNWVRLWFVSSPLSPKLSRKTANTSSARHGGGRGRPSPSAVPSPLRVGVGGHRKEQWNSESRCLSHRPAGFFLLTCCCCCCRSLIWSQLPRVRAEAAEGHCSAEADNPKHHGCCADRARTSEADRFPVVPVKASHTLFTQTGELAAKIKHSPSLGVFFCFAAKKKMAVTHLQSVHHPCLQRTHTHTHSKSA